MSTFEFREIDEEGMETLDVISEAVGFNEWMYSTIKPYCRGAILEIGSGIGNISTFFVRDKAQITLSDIRDNYCDRLRESYGHGSEAKAVEKIDLVNPAFDSEYGHLIGTFDTVFALNVVEHIKDDRLALKNCHKLLRNQGQVVILVPAYQALYNQFDVELGHFRRYTRTHLVSAIRTAGFQLVHSQYFNFAGILGWYVSGKLQKNKTIPSGQMKLYNALVPVFKLVDFIMLRSVGLSVIAVGKKLTA